MFFQLDDYPLRTTVCYLSAKNDLRSKPFTSLHLRLLRSPLCHILSSVFDKSRRTLRTTKDGFVSRVMNMPCVMAISCLRWSYSVKTQIGCCLIDSLHQKLVNTIKLQLFKYFWANWSIIVNCLLFFVHKKKVSHFPNVG